MVEVKKGDITLDSVRAIVNTTNADITTRGGWYNLQYTALLCTDRQ